jgi:hypothetical protein
LHNISLDGFELYSLYVKCSPLFYKRDDCLLENSSEEDEDEEEKEENSLDFNNNHSSASNLNELIKTSEESKSPSYQKSKAKKKDKTTSKLAKKGKNRLIKSMQNLLFYDRSRSSSTDSLNSSEMIKNPKLKNSNKNLQDSTTSCDSPTSIKYDTSGKSDIIRSLFVS